MRETQMFEEIWKEFQREISEEQAFSLSLLMAFSWHYGEWQDDFGLDIGSGAMVSQGSLIESIKGIQGYDVREAFSRLSERINWQMVEQEAVQRLLKKMIDCFVWYGKKGEDPREVFALILDLMGRDGKCVLTPPGVRRVIVELLGPRKAKHLASSCCGGAGLGLELWDYLRLRNPEISFCGEEQSRELCDVANLYSYAYAGDLQVGQTVNVSIPALMTSVPGTVEAVHMVSRITPEGSKLFSADIIVENEGALTADMVASATATVNGETVYPYEAGKLAYYRTGDLVSTVDGTVISSNLVDYLQVAPGQVLVRIDGEESESQLFTIQQNLDTAREELKTAEENLANCNAKAPIDGMVIGLTIQPGDEIAANTAVVTISDTSSVVITANVDERNISYIKPGMPVELSQWGTPAFGTVETVSLSSTVNNGVATYPITISADNSEGTLQVNSYIDYTLTASENDNCLVLPLQCVRTVTQEDGSTVNVVFVKGSRPDNAIETPTLSEEIPEGFWAVPVEIGISDNSNVEIKSGVEEGTEVFTQIQSLQAWG